jgi:hypothetical protein
MKSSIETLLYEALVQPKDAIYYYLSRALSELYPDFALLETEVGAFQVTNFARSGHCTLTQKLGIHSEAETHYHPKDKCSFELPYSTWSIATWEGNEFHLIQIGVEGRWSRDIRTFLLGTNAELVDQFFCTVCEWNSEVRGEVLVFDGQCWHKDSDLYEGIQNATLENLVLEKDLKTQISEDFQSFFDKEDVYAKYNIPWKRGVLLLGPPGNGKTHTIKGLVNLLNKPCLYVRSFTSDHGSDQQAMTAVFERARATAPCLLILEDLDSLIDDDNRSFFLNEMDGFASNHGIMTVATTNHPERLDPAILVRPSRFDRKYTFRLPEFPEREKYLRLRNESLEHVLQLNDQELEDLAALTDEFSFAYLKELFLSAIMVWVDAPEGRRMFEIMSEQITTLREQMKTEVISPADTAEAYEDELDPHMMAAAARARSAMARAMARRGY